jgi:REP element-mobilizing transposase RayT
MARTYTKILIHCVYSTKNRTSSIPEPERVWKMTREIARNLKIDILAIGGTSDHLHLLLALPSDRRLADIIRDLKANSSLILRQQNRRFHWQDGYGAISVSPGVVPAAIRYIQNQEHHHRGVPFATEYLAMLDKAGITYAKEYVLD